MTDPEKSKGRKKGSTEVRNKGKKVQSDNTVNEQEAPDTLTCNRCKRDIHKCKCKNDMLV